VILDTEFTKNIFYLFLVGIFFQAENGVFITYRIRRKNGYYIVYFPGKTMSITQVPGSTLPLPPIVATNYPD